MRVYTSNNKDAQSNVEISLNHKELKALTVVLTNFENQIEQFKISNKDKDDFGFTHLHLKDCGLISGKSESDIVFYIDLNDK